jgi:hypothetical protein
MINATEIIAEVQAERYRQHAKWGPQSFPNGTGPDGILMGRPFAQYEQVIKNFVDRLAGEGESQWVGILLEEVFEAAAEPDVAKLRVELVQVMAVAQAWVEDIDLKHGAELLV